MHVLKLFFAKSLCQLNSYFASWKKYSVFPYCYILLHCKFLLQTNLSRGKIKCNKRVQSINWLYCADISQHLVVSFFVYREHTKYLSVYLLLRGPKLIGPMSHKLPNWLNIPSLLILIRDTWCISIACFITPEEDPGYCPFSIKLYLKRTATWPFERLHNRFKNLSCLFFFPSWNK